MDPLSPYSDQETDRRERKGWRVKIHDLSGSAVAAAFITTPFVPSAGCDWVARSNPGAWLIARPDSCTPDSWEPWGKLEAWRERGGFICCRFHLIISPEVGGQDRVGGLLMSEMFINAEKGGEFCIDTDRVHKTMAVSPQENADFSPGPSSCPYPGPGPGQGPRGFVMSCRVKGEGKSSKPLVQLAMRHVTCIEDAAIFMALAAAVDLSIHACRLFPRKFKHDKRQKLN